MTISRLRWRRYVLDAAFAFEWFVALPARCLWFAISGKVTDG